MQTNEIALQRYSAHACVVQVPVAGWMMVGTGCAGAGSGDVRDGNDDDNGIKYMANV